MAALLALMVFVAAIALSWLDMHPRSLPTRAGLALAGKILVVAVAVALSARLAAVPSVQWLSTRDQLLANWGAGDWLATTGLAATFVGVILALRSLSATEHSAREAADWARRLVEHEQSADLIIPFRPGEFEDEIPDGAYLWVSSQPANQSAALIRGRLRNIGRYGARDVSLRVFQGDRPLVLWNEPPTYIEADSHAYLFEFELPLGQVDANGDLSTLFANFSENDPITIVVDYADGNQWIAEEGMARIFRFRFDGDRPWVNWSAVDVDFEAKLSRRKL